MKVAVVMMQRNEDLCLGPWLRYHGALFGDENLFVLDHHSDDPGVVVTLSEAAARGVHVMRLAASADYRQKGDFVSYAMRQAEAGYDFVLPLDCDEFVVMRLPWGQPSCAPAEILEYFETLPASALAFGVNENFLNMLGRPKTFFALPYEKVFFSRRALRRCRPWLAQGAVAAHAGARNAAGLCALSPQILRALPPHRAGETRAIR